MEPNQNIMDDFISNFEQQILSISDSRLSMFGPRTVDLNKEKLPDKIVVFEGLEEFKHRFLEPTVFA